jgi:PAS domain S-box-containing protein
MTVSWLATYRALLFLSLAVGLFVGYQAVRYRDRPGGKPLLVLVAGSLLYVVVKMIVSFVRGTPTVFVITRFNPLGAGLASAGFFLLVLEYTGIEYPVSKRTATAVGLVPAVGSALALIDLEYLWVPVGADSSTLSGYAWELTSVALANQLYMSLLLLAGIGLLVRQYIESPNIFTAQVGALILSASGPVIGNLAFQLGYVQFNLTPVLFVISGAIIAWAILRVGFLDLIPIGRETVLDQFDAGVVTLDTNHRVIDLNEHGCQLFDVSNAGTIVGDHVDDLFADHPAFRDRYWAATSTGSGHGTTLEEDGRYFSVDVIPLGPRAETIVGRSVIIRDITDQTRREEELKRREQEVERAREQLRQIIDLVPDPLFVKNMDDEVLLSNEANAELHGMTRKEIEGEREFDIEPEVENIENFDKYRQREIEVIERGESMTFEEELLGPDGETRIFKTTRIPFETSGTDEAAVLGYARDVTDLKEYEQELEATKRRLEESNEKLDQFASMVSHDLRNPLTVIKGRTELLRGQAPAEDVNHIANSADRMETMIEDLLTLSRAGESVDDPEPISLTGVTDDSWAAVSSDDLELDVDIPDDVEVDADGDRLRHVFENLFRNAGEHNDPPVTIRVGTLSDETGSVSGFFVADDGSGIPGPDREAVFEHGYTTNEDGTGFGLSIVEEIVEAHGWRISVSESEAGGARFEVHTASQN